MMYLTPEMTFGAIRPEGFESIQPERFETLQPENLDCKDDWENESEEE